MGRPFNHEEFSRLTSSVGLNVTPRADEAKRHWVDLVCPQCSTSFSKLAAYVTAKIKEGRSGTIFCSRKCDAESKKIHLRPEPVILPHYMELKLDAVCQQALENGKAAEHLVCADLILRGYQACLSGQGMPYDVVLDSQNRPVRVQVKSTARAGNLPQRKDDRFGYLWNVRRCGRGGRQSYTYSEFDILALVALDIRCIAYIPVNDTIAQTMILYPPGSDTRKRRKYGNIDEYPIEKALGILNKDPW